MYVVCKLCLNPDVLHFPSYEEYLVEKNQHGQRSNIFKYTRGLLCIQTDTNTLPSKPLRPTFPLRRDLSFVTVLISDYIDC